MVEIYNDIIKRLEKEINLTPTGELRNLLSDANIMIQTLNSLCDANIMIQTLNSIVINDDDFKYNH